MAVLSRVSRIVRDCAAVAMVLIAVALPAQAERVKDIATVAGVRVNQLVGYGLVVGLKGTGDQTSQAPFTTQSLKNMLTELGVQVPANVDPQLKNVAAVMVTATLEPFAKTGQRIDVTVSSIANAGSLRGGTLVMTPLKGADGKVYAVAQGDLIVGGFDAEGSDGSQITVNIPSVGRIPNGATVEREVPTGFARGDAVTLNLHRADFTTALRVAEAVNAAMGEGTAQPLDAASVRVDAPTAAAARVAFMAELETLEVEPGAAAARVIVNSRTGTVVIGQSVRVMPAAVSHGKLVVRIAERPEVSQPEALSQGETTVVPRSQVEVTEEAGRMFKFGPGVDLDTIVTAVNEVGAAPSDLVAILQALEQVGALQGELVVI
jgi:flagellar P-ring protein precursor FlgI